MPRVVLLLLALSAPVLAQPQGRDPRLHDESDRETGRGARGSN